MFAKLFTPILGLAACLLAQKIIPYESPVTYISPDSLETREFVFFFYRYPMTTTLPPGTTVQEFSVWKCCLSKAIGPNLFIRDKKPEEYWKFPDYKLEDLFCCFIDSALKRYEIWVTECRIFEKHDRPEKKKPLTMDRTFCNL